VTFDNVKVPVTNMIGKPGNGFKYIMYKYGIRSRIRFRNNLVLIMSDYPESFMLYASVAN
jgi:hypothetical protein